MAPRSRSVPLRAEAPNACRAKEVIWFPDDLKEQITIFHASAGYDRTVHESIRELIWQGLSGDAKATAVRLAARRAYLDTKVMMMTRLGTVLKELWGHLEEIVNITAAESATVTTLEEPPR